MIDVLLAGSVSSMLMVACGQAAAAAVSSASASARREVASRLRMTPPASVAVIDTDVTAAPVAPGGLALAEMRSCAACWTPAKIVFNCSGVTAPDAFAPPPTAAVGSNRAPSVAAAVATPCTVATTCVEVGGAACEHAPRTSNVMTPAASGRTRFNFRW